MVWINRTVVNLNYWLFIHDILCLIWLGRLRCFMLFFEWELGYLMLTRTCIILLTSVSRYLQQATCWNMSFRRCSSSVRRRSSNSRDPKHRCCAWSSAYLRKRCFLWYFALRAESTSRSRLWEGTFEGLQRRNHSDSTMNWYRLVSNLHVQLSCQRGSIG